MQKLLFFFLAFGFFNLNYSMASSDCQNLVNIDPLKSGSLPSDELDDLGKVAHYSFEDGAEESAPTEEQLEEAASKLRAFLKGERGEAAVVYILAAGDKNGDGVGDSDELEDFLKVINLGNFLTRPYWVEGLLDTFGTGKPKVMNQSSIKKMLVLMDLY